MSLLNPEPTCTVDASSTGNGVDVTAGATVTIALSDTAGVKQWQISCISTDEENSSSTVNTGLTINQIAKTATFTAPAAGSALIFRSRVNNGNNSDGTPNASYTTTFGVYVRTSTALRVLAFGEKTESSTSFGWVTTFNDIVRNASLGAANYGNGLQYSGGVVSVKPDPAGYTSVSAAGIKVVATELNTLNTIVKRGAGGDVSLPSTSCDSLDVNTSFVVGGVSEFQAAVTVHGLLSSEFGESLSAPTFGVAITESRVAPSQAILRTGTGWSYSTNVWTNTTVGTILEIPIHPPHLAVLNSVTVRYQGAAAHAALPAVMPTVSVGYVEAATNSTQVVTNSTASDSSASTAAFQAAHNIVSNNAGAGIAHAFDRERRRYYVLVTAESGANSLVGASFWTVTLNWTRSAGAKIGQD